MKDFQTIVSQLAEQLYTAYNMVLTAICEDPQNAAYGAGTFQIPFVLEQQRRKWEK